MALKYSFNEHYFDQIDTPEKAYWLGVIWTDGGISLNKGGKTYGRLRITTAEHSKTLLEAFAKAVNTTKPITTSNTASTKNGPKKYRRSELCLCSAHICSVLMGYGIVPRKTYSEQFPTFPKEFTSHFVRGMFDGDGSIYRNGKYKNVDITGSKASCEWLLNNIPIFLGFGGYISPKPNSEVTFRWRIGARNEVMRFREWIYSDSTVCFEPKFKRFYE